MSVARRCTRWRTLNSAPPDTSTPIARGTTRTASGSERKSERKVYNTFVKQIANPAQQPQRAHRSRRSAVRVIDSSNREAIFGKNKQSLGHRLFRRRNSVPGRAGRVLGTGCRCSRARTGPGHVRGHERDCPPRSFHRRRPAEVWPAEPGRVPELVQRQCVVMTSEGDQCH